jgi:CheY-like chemotaxis protein
MAPSSQKWFVGSREACLNAGAAEYLRKPPDAGLLIQVIERISGMSPSALTNRA